MTTDQHTHLVSCSWYQSGLQALRGFSYAISRPIRTNLYEWLKSG